MSSKEFLIIGSPAQLKRQCFFCDEYFELQDMMAATSEVCQMFICKHCFPDASSTFKLPAGVDPDEFYGVSAGKDTPLLGVILSGMYNKKQVVSPISIEMEKQRLIIQELKRRGYEESDTIDKESGYPVWQKKDQGAKT